MTTASRILHIKKLGQLSDLHSQSLKNKRWFCGHIRAKFFNCFPLKKLIKEENAENKSRACFNDLSAVCCSLQAPTNQRRRLPTTLVETKQWQRTAELLDQEDGRQALHSIRTRARAFLTRSGAAFEADSWVVG